MFKKIKINKDMIFPAVGFVIILLIAIFVFYFIRFLIDKMNISLNIGSGLSQNVSRINFEGLKKIGIME